ncbi:MAG TPA: recombinase family protein [Bordetella sp.]|uniref:recombinase family protein n=1 Tax=Bordetella sp. TaxID=28081 RepID=UPI002ED3ABD6
MKYLSDNQEASMARIAYYRVSTRDQSIEAQRHAMGSGQGFEREFSDEGVSGTVAAKDRPGFAALLSYVREGDTVHVYAVDRLGRDALDVQATVRGLIDKGVTVEVHGLGAIGRGVGELILAVLAQVADMERGRIAERTAAGRDKAKADGKHMGRPASIEGEKAVDALTALDDGGTVLGVAKDFGISRQALLRLRDSNAKHAQETQARAGLWPDGRPKIQHADLYLESICSGKEVSESSAKSYMSYLRGTASHLGKSITPALLHDKAHIDRLACELEGKVSPKTISNWKSAMARYVEMVQKHELSRDGR